MQNYTPGGTACPMKSFLSTCHFEHNKYVAELFTVAVIDVEGLSSRNENTTSALELVSAKGALRCLPSRFKHFQVGKVVYDQGKTLATTAMTAMVRRMR